MSLEAAKRTAIQFGSIRCINMQQSDKYSVDRALWGERCDMAVPVRQLSTNIWTYSFTSAWAMAKAKMIRLGPFAQGQVV